MAVKKYGLGEGPTGRSHQRTSWKRKIGEQSPFSQTHISYGNRYKLGRYITSEIAIITLIKPEEKDKEKALHDAIIHELQTNPFWGRWKIEKVTLLEATQTEPRIEA